MGDPLGISFMGNPWRQWVGSWLISRILSLKPLERLGPQKAKVKKQRIWQGRWRFLGTPCFNMPRSKLLMASMSLIPASFLPQSWGSLVWRPGEEFGMLPVLLMTKDHQQNRIIAGFQHVVSNHFQSMGVTPSHHRKIGLGAPWSTGRSGLGIGAHWHQQRRAKSEGPSGSVVSDKIRCTAASPGNV